MKGGRTWRIRVIGVRLLIVAGSALFSLLLAEIGLRLFYPQKRLDERGGYVPVPGSRYYLLRANYRKDLDGRVNKYTFFTNSYGIRDFEFDPQVSHPRRVLFLGDSFTEGVWVDLEKTFVKQFEMQIRKLTGTDWQALNLALAGGSTFDEIYSYQVKGVPLVHKYVVLGFYVGNDLSDNLQFRERPLYDGHTETLFTRSQRLRRFFAFHSHLWNLAASRLDWPVLYRLGIRSGDFTFLAYLKREQSKEVKAAWDLTFAALETLNKAVAGHDAELVLLLIPHKIQVNEQVFEKTVREHGCRPSGFDRNKPQRVLMAFAHQARVPVVDLLDWFEGNENYYFSNDIHYNENGHKRTGEVLARAFVNYFQPNKPLDNTSNPVLPGVRVTAHGLAEQ